MSAAQPGICNSGVKWGESEGHSARASIILGDADFHVSASGSLENGDIQPISLYSGAAPA